MSVLVKCLAPASPPLLPRSFSGPCPRREQDAGRVLSHCVGGPEIPLAIFAFLAFQFS
jgi:hypothetical protein